MRALNKKGFSLMELLVALFISGMVTISLVSIWRGASVQTSQAQRQAVVRNNLSIFLRQIFRDISEADIILYPTATGGTLPNMLVVGAYNARRTATIFAPGHTELGPHRYFYYCHDSAAGAVRYGSVTRELYVAGTDNTINLSAMTIKGINDLFNNDLASGCQGDKVMDNVQGVNLSLDGVRYTLNLRVYREFPDKSIPVNIEFSGTFTSAGGS